MWPSHGFPPPRFIDSFLHSLYRLFLWAGDALNFTVCHVVAAVVRFIQLHTFSAGMIQRTLPPTTTADREKLIIKKEIDKDTAPSLGAGL